MCTEKCSHGYPKTKPETEHYREMNMPKFKLPRLVKAVLAGMGISAAMIIFTSVIFMIGNWVEATFGREAMQFTLLFIFFSTMCSVAAYFTWFAEDEEDEGASEGGEMH